jgi:hypothetical protein
MHRDRPGCPSLLLRPPTRSGFPPPTCCTSFASRRRGRSGASPGSPRDPAPPRAGQGGGRATPPPADRGHARRLRGRAERRPTRVHRRRHRRPWRPRGRAGARHPQGARSGARHPVLRPRGDRGGGDRLPSGDRPGDRRRPRRALRASNRRPRTGEL